MFGYKFFSQRGQENYSTPQEFQDRAREELADHVQHLKQQGGLESIRRRRKRRLFARARSKAAHEDSKEDTVMENDGPVVSQGKEESVKDRKGSLTYGSSPLRRMVSIDSSSDASSTEAASIDSGNNGFEQMSMVSSGTFDRSSLFSGTQLAQIYTSSTAPTTVTDGASTLMSIPDTAPVVMAPNTNVLTLSQALPSDFSDYYATELNVPRFSNMRPKFTKRKLKSWELNDIRSLLIYPELKPEWHGKVPSVISPYTGLVFRIQVIPLSCPDEHFAECLANSDIYCESSLDAEFRLGTARYIVEKARRRHRSILEQNYRVPPEAFDEMTNTVGDVKYDEYFKYEWRNIIENYLLNIGIENQCRYEFKDMVSKLRRLGQRSVAADSLYKKALSSKTADLDEATKMQVWRDVQQRVYDRLDMAA